jgi:ubiquinone/menaquinone biosynthesis C-methylase UbiE
VPAAGRHWALPFYDPVVSLIGANPTRRVLIDQADLGRGQQVLEIGCGTGSLVTLLKRLYPDVEVVGLDPDPKALARAAQKAERAAVSVRFDRGFSDELPYRDRSFDRVLSSFMFHHLPADVKARTLTEVKRVLKPGGVLLLLDFAAHGRGGEDDRVIERMRAAGFAHARQMREDALLFGRLRVRYYAATCEASVDASSATESRTSSDPVSAGVR